MEENESLKETIDERKIYSTAKTKPRRLACRT